MTEGLSKEQRVKLLRRSSEKLVRALELWAIAEQEPLIAKILDTVASLLWAEAMVLYEKVVLDDLRTYIENSIKSDSNQQIEQP